MPTVIESWQLEAPNTPLVRQSQPFDSASLAADEVLIEVAGCGVCHTDLGFAYDGVRTRHPLPLTLGYEIAGRVAQAGASSGFEPGELVVVPAVIPCGQCEACEGGRGAVCTHQIFPGNDAHGGFASHVVVPARGLCRVDAAALEASGIALADLAVVADAVTTPYQAVVNAELKAGDLAIFIGIGGVGGFGVQIAKALGATVVAIDVDERRLVRIGVHGADLCLPSGESRAVRKAIRTFAKEHGLPSIGWKIFETSGHPAGQELAYGLLGPDAHLGVVGYTRERINLRLSNLIAFDATARGTWGCLPEHYAAAVNLVLSGAVELGPFVEQFPMSSINEVFDRLHHHGAELRPVLIPDFDLK